MHYIEGCAALYMHLTYTDVLYVYEVYYSKKISQHFKLQFRSHGVLLKFGKSPVSQQIHQSFPPPNIHAIW